MYETELTRVTHVSRVMNPVHGHHTPLVLHRSSETFHRLNTKMKSLLQILPQSDQSIASVTVTNHVLAVDQTTHDLLPQMIMQHRSGVALVISRIMDTIPIKNLFDPQKTYNLMLRTYTNFCLADKTTCERPRMRFLLIVPLFFLHAAVRA